MDQDMQQYLDKAEVLIEALTYIQRFNRKIIVDKIKKYLFAFFKLTAFLF